MALWAQARVKRWCKRPPASPATAAAMQTPPGARPSRDPVARRMVPGRPLERFGNGPPRWMTVLDRIRLTDGLETWKPPLTRGFPLFGGSPGCLYSVSIPHEDRAKGRIDGFRGPLIVVRPQVRVGVQRFLSGRMAQPPLHDRHRTPDEINRDRVMVSEFVESVTLGNPN